MKTLKLILAALAIIASAATAEAQQSDKPKKLVIVEGHFFDEIPVANDNITALYMLATPSGTRATGVEMSEPLPEEALQFALPAEEVAEAGTLLRLFDQAKAAGKGIRVSFAKAEKLIAEGSRFPQFSATDIDGRVWSNADVEGKVMVLNLWFTGCGPCRAEMPELSQWRTEIDDVMFFSSTWEDAATARPVLESCGFNWTALVSDRQFKEWIGSAGYPLTIVVDKQGTVAKVEYGTSPLQRAELKQTILSLR